MTTYTAIPNGDVDQDSPVTQPLLTLLRDNPIAVTEGAAGAPRIVGAAMKRLVDYPVLTVTAADTTDAGTLFDGTFSNTSTSLSTFQSAGTMESVLATGTVRFKFTASETGTADVETRLTKNGSTVNTYSGPGVKTEDIALVPGDVIELLVRDTAVSPDNASVGTFVITASDSYEVRPAYVKYSERNTA